MGYILIIIILTSSPFRSAARAEAADCFLYNIYIVRVVIVII